MYGLTNPPSRIHHWEMGEKPLRQMWTWLSNASVVAWLAPPVIKFVLVPVGAALVGLMVWEDRPHSLWITIPVGYVTIVVLKLVIVAVDDLVLDPIRSRLRTLLRRDAHRFP